ncbi:hypothetical protein [Nonomuraea typhae]|uniref:Uncharacterized protein n=1 Tax=Nonomuraea typhae TaxID=2603600 RepID=A0ABW7Z475_9ACTN
MRMLWLLGPSGVGKSATGFEVFRRLAGDGIAAAFLDTDQLSLIHPGPAQGTHAVRARALAALWPVYRRAGVRWLVVAGYVDGAADLEVYGAALGAAGGAVVRVWLRAGQQELRRRFLGRGWLPGQLDAALEQARRLEREVGSELEGSELVAGTDGLSVGQAAALVRRLAGLPTGPAGTHEPPPSWAPSPAVTGDWRAAAGVPVLWLYGPRGVGASTAGFEAFRLLARSAGPAAYLDLRQLGFHRPAPHADDGAPVEDRPLALEALRALWPLHLRHGARRLVVAAGSHPPAPGLLPGAAMTVRHLRASSGTLAARLEARRRGQGPVVPGDDLAGRTAEQLRVLAARPAPPTPAGVLTLDTDGRTPRQVAALLVSALDGQLPPGPSA